MTPDVLHTALEKVDFRLPTQVTDDASVVALKSLVFEPLLRWQPGGQVAPGLFSSWTHLPDGRVWTFHVRPNAVFHDGVPCMADLIITYINGFLDSTDYFGMPWSYRRYFAETVFTAEDDQTLRVENPEPFADILDIFCDFWPVRLDPQGKPVLGTGPYRVTEISRENGTGKAALQRVNGTSKSDGKPDIILCSHIPDASQRLSLSLLRDSKVDVALNLESVEGLTQLTFDSSLFWNRVRSTLSVIYRRFILLSW